MAAGSAYMNQALASAGMPCDGTGLAGGAGGGVTARGAGVVVAASFEAGKDLVAGAAAGGSAFSQVSRLQTNGGIANSNISR